jgi:hypothetical protein
MNANEGVKGLLDPEIAQNPVNNGVQRPSYTVGIGASARGLEAVDRRFDQIPVNTGMAFVVVQDLSPDFKSVMDELFVRKTRTGSFLNTLDLESCPLLFGPGEQSLGGLAIVQLRSSKSLER